MTESTTADVAPDEDGGLWRGDAGELPDRTRRVLLRLVRGPYLSGAREAQLWAVLLTDEAVLRSRLADLFLELVIDRDNEFAFVRNAPSEDAPKAVRSEALTFLDTAMLLVLRQTLLSEEGRGRVIVGQVFRIAAHARANGGAGRQAFQTAVMVGANAAGVGVVPVGAQKHMADFRVQKAVHQLAAG